MDLTIYTYGYGETIFNTLNAIAMVRNSSYWPAMINMIMMLVGGFYAWQMALSRAEGQWRSAMLKVAGMLFLVNALMLPKTNMLVKDNVEKRLWKVDNIPLAFALPVGGVEQMGHLVTILFEQAFSTVGGASSFNYYNYGSIFGARLSRELMEIKVRDPEFTSNMQNFIKRCVVLPAMIGGQFTKEELVASKDMWGLIRDRAGTLTRADMTINGTRQSPAPTCKQATQYFENKFNYETSASINSLSWKFKAVGDSNIYNPHSLNLNENIKKQISALYNNSTSVDTILKHNMMVNAFNDYRSGKYPAAKARMAQEAGGLIPGDMANYLLTKFLSVMKNIMYGSFIFVAPLMILSGGMGKYKSWIIMCLSLQLWPALFAMLNMVIDYANEPGKIISYSVWSTTAHKFDGIASIAAGLTMLIPFLAFWVVRMGEGGFLHLAGNIMASANSASSMAASEMASGTRRWDETSIGNDNRHNESSNKINTSMERVIGGNSATRGDGSLERVTSGGMIVRSGGAGYSASSGETSYSEHDGISSAITNNLRREESELSSDTAAFARSREQVETMEASASFQIAENTRMDSGYNIDTSTESGKELVKGLNEIDRLNESNDYSWQQNAKAYSRANASFGKSLQNFLGIGASVEVGGEIEAGNSSSQSNTQTLENSQETSVHDRSSNSERESKNEAYLESLGIDKSIGENMRAAYSESSRLESSMAFHRDQISSWNKTLDYSESHGTESRKECYQDVVDGLMEKNGWDHDKAYSAASSRSPEAREVFDNLAVGKAYTMKDQIESGKQKIEKSTAVSDFKDIAGDYINADPRSNKALKKFKNENDITGKEEAESLLVNQGEYIENEFIAKSSSNNTEFGQLKETLDNQYNLGEDKIAKFEEDRIGRGKFSTVFGLTDGLGRPPETSKQEPYIRATSSVVQISQDQSIPEFEPIMKYHGSDKMISNINVPREGSPDNYRSNEQKATVMNNLNKK